jgi:site-specific recombinase XerD
MRRWEGLVEKFGALLEARGVGKATIATRTRELERFGKWLKGRKPRPALEAVDADLIARYVGDRSAFRARATVSGVVSHLRCMGEFLVQEGVWRVNPLRWMRGPKLDHRRHIPRRIDASKLNVLWDAAGARPQEHARYQALCVLAILYSTGLRRGELSRLSVGDWDRDGGVLRIDGRKTGCPRSVPVGEGVWRCIEAYLPRRHNRLEQTGRLQEQALIVNSHGERLNGDNVANLLKRLCKSAGIEQLTPHQFRHSCASDLIATGVALPDVQRMLGHAFIVSTMRYVDVSAPERAAAMSKHPINQFLQGSNVEGGAHVEA